MSIVKINAITVPEGRGAELEARFAARKHAVDAAPGFEGFQLLRPVAGESRYFVVTQWRSEADYEAWRAADRAASAAGHGAQGLGAQGLGGAHPEGGTAGGHGHGAAPVALGAELLEFEVVEL